MCDEEKAFLVLRRRDPNSRINKAYAQVEMPLLMKAVKYNKGGKLKVSQKTVSVDPPQGYHWMEERVATS